MLKYMDREHVDIINAINEKQALDADLEAKINEALTRFGEQYESMIEG